MDPRYKFAIFDALNRERYRIWLEEEAQAEAKKLFESSHKTLSRQKSGDSDMSLADNDDFLEPKT